MKKFLISMLALLLCACMLTACDEAKDTEPIDSNLQNNESAVSLNNFTLFGHIEKANKKGNYIVNEKADRNFILNTLNKQAWYKSNISQEQSPNFILRVNQERDKTDENYDRENIVRIEYYSKIGTLKLDEYMLNLSKDDKKELERIIDDAIDGGVVGSLYYKPVIYLYPEKDTISSVKLNIDGELTCTYPAYGKDGWQNFTATPDGTLTFPDGREYYCLYWEGRSQSFENDFSKGFCVKGSDSAEFLNSALLQLGLTPREANEFIIYWLPKLEANEYNLLSFQLDNYANSAPLEITPTPDSILRVFLAMKPLDDYVEIEPQQLPDFERKGFTVVEWGGTWVE